MDLVDISNAEWSYSDVKFLENAQGDTIVLGSSTDFQQAK